MPNLTYVGKNDLILRKFKCSIRHDTPMIPIADPLAKNVLYCQSLLLQWLSMRATSPLTRAHFPVWKVHGHRKYIIEGLIHYRIDPTLLSFLPFRRRVF